jgi:hypothetical protein
MDIDKVRDLTYDVALLLAAVSTLEGLVSEDPEITQARLVLNHKLFSYEKRLTKLLENLAND